jgi:hypothetical protein
MNYMSDGDSPFSGMGMEVKRMYVAPAADVCRARLEGVVAAMLLSPRGEMVETG